MERLAERAIFILRQALGASLLLLVLLTLMQVALRYLFHHSIDWVEEISVIVLTWLAWLGATLLWLQRRHPAVDILAGALSPPARLLLHRLFDATAVVAAKKKGMEFIDTDKSGFMKAAQPMIAEKEGTVWPKGLADRIKAIK